MYIAKDKESGECVTPRMRASGKVGEEDNERLKVVKFCPKCGWDFDS